MRKVLLFIYFVTFSLLSQSTWALLSLELTQGTAGAIPISIVPFGRTGGTPTLELASVINSDLASSGRFKIFPQDKLTQFPTRQSNLIADYFRHLNIDNVVVGEIKRVGADQYQVNFQLLDMYHSKNQSNVLLSSHFTVSANQLRQLAHHISDVVYQKLTGIRGVFSTKIVYVMIQRNEAKQARYFLQVADQDGFNTRSLLISKEPIMSPAWSPNGRYVAYVSFENQHASIYVQDVKSGTRRLISEFPGINGAPAWSPDGRKLAFVLSKTGAPNIYVLDIYSKQLKQLTHDFYINTEPSWSPDGKTMLFTSNRGGGPQIYQINLSNGGISRVTYDGDYNARASYTRDGSHVVMIHRASGTYNIAVLDLDKGTVRIISNSSLDSDSPSVAPNGTMILYDTFINGRSTLSMVSADGRTRLVLPIGQGEAQDPAWSPFLT